MTEFAKPTPYNHAQWRKHAISSARLAVVIVAAALLIGVCGYHFIGHLPWVDSILEAAMILGGMGPVATMANDAIKLFAAGYALFSGLVLVGATGVLIGPWLHRLIHHPNHAHPKSVK